MKNILLTLLVFGFIVSKAQYNICLGDFQELCPYENVTIHLCNYMDSILIPSNDSIMFVNNLSIIPMTDDIYSNPIPIGFPFTFYGNTYPTCLISSNGYISFDLANAGGYSPWSIGAAVPSPALPLNSVFGVYQDIYPGTTGIIQYGTIGVAPNRIFVVRFIHITMFDLATCPGMEYCGTILLYESSNNIEVHTFDKAECPAWNAGAGIEGIQDASGTNGITVPGRNYPMQWTSFQDGKRFTPQGGVSYLVDSIRYLNIIETQGPIDSAYLADSLRWYSVEGNHLVGYGLTYMFTPATYPYLPLPTGDTIHFYPAFPYPASPDSNCDLGGLYRIIPPATIHVKPQPFPMFTVQNIDCHSQGSITINNAPFDSYIWSDATYNGSPVAMNVPPGMYSVTVSENGCTGTNSAIVDSSGMSNSLTTTDDSCGRGTGSIVVQTNGTSAPFNYVWGPGVTNLPSQNDAEGLTGGNYSVIISDAVGCADTFNVTILTTNSLPPAPIPAIDYCLNAVSTPITLTGSNIQFYDAATGGNLILSPFSPPTSVVGAQIYWATQTISGCESSTTEVDVNVHPNPTIAFAIFDSMFCQNGSTTLQLNAESNVGYVWNVTGNSFSIVNNNTIILDGANAGNVTVNITAIDTVWGCSSNATTNVTVSPKPVSNISASNTDLCPGETTTLSTNYAGTNFWSTGITGSSITVSVAGNYYLVSESADGCFSDTSFVNVFAHPNPVISFLQFDSLFCQNSSTTLELNPQSNTGFVWNISGANTYSQSDNTTVIINGNNAGAENINITATDTIYGCTGNLQTSLNVSPKPVSNILAGDTSFCAGLFTTLTSTFIGNNFWSTGETGNSISVSQTGDYFLVSESTDGCLSDTSFMHVTVIPFVYPEILTSDTTIHDGESVVISVTNSANNPSLTYIWTSSSYLSCNNCSSNTAAPPIGATTFYVTLDYPCTSYDSITITVESKHGCYMPNAFSPNGDGVNDELFPFFQDEYRLFRYDIYNRWGELVWGDLSGWNGYYKGSPQPMGTYVYILTFQMGGEMRTLVGTFTLLR